MHSNGLLGRKSRENGDLRAKFPENAQKSSTRPTLSLTLTMKDNFRGIHLFRDGVIYRQDEIKS